MTYFIVGLMVVWATVIAAVSLALYVGFYLVRGMIFSLKVNRYQRDQGFTTKRIWLRPWAWITSGAWLADTDVVYVRGRTVTSPFAKLDEEGED